MFKIWILIALFFFYILTPIYSESVEIPSWIKHDVKQHNTQKIGENTVIDIIQNLIKLRILNTDVSSSFQVFEVPKLGKNTFVPFSGDAKESGKSGFVFIEITNPNGIKEYLQTPILETGSYSTVYLINDKSQKGEYQVISKFESKIISVDYFYIQEKFDSPIPTWIYSIFNWWFEGDISDKDFIQSMQFLINSKILIVPNDNTSMNQLIVSVDGERMIRRGTTQTITTNVFDGNNPVSGAKVILTIEDYDENIIRKFDGYTNQKGDFIFSWEIPTSFDNLKTLLAFISVTNNGLSNTSLFKFQVYCLPIELNCKIEGN